MSSASSVVRPDDITVVAHGQGSIVRCRRTRRTLVLGPRETRFIAACSRPRHVEDLKIEVGSDFTGHDVEKLIVLFRDFGVLRCNDTPSAHQRLWSFRLLTIRMSGTCQHPRLLRVLADTISAGGALSVIVSVWLITCHAPQVVHDLINQRYISMSSLIIYILSVVLVGFLHESSHAIAINARGGHVFEAGFLLMFAIPSFYIDASGIATIRSRPGRLQAWSAGLSAQAILLATSLLFIVYDPGAPQWFKQFLLLTSCINLAMMLANAVPIVRLDGYRVFCELIGVTDLLRLGSSALAGRPIAEIPGHIELGLATFFTIITGIFVPCLVITAVSSSISTWTRVSLTTFSHVIIVIMCVSLVTTFIRFMYRHFHWRIHRA